MKTCTRCKRELELDRFCINRRQKSGLNSSCKDCQKKCNAAYDHKAWRDENRERLCAWNREWRAKNPEQCKAYRRSVADRQCELQAAWRAANPDRVKNGKAAWKENNRARVRVLNKRHRQRNQHRFTAKEAARRFAKRQAQPAWANEFFMEEAYHLAKLRTAMTGIRWEVDHRVPLKSPLVCGLHVETNLAVIPASLNRSKSNKYWPDMP